MHTVQFARPIMSDTPTDEQQKVILELFLAGHSLRGMSNLLNFDVSPEGIEAALRGALENLRDYAVALRDTLEGNQ
jgi:hypothetical protein